MSHVVAMHYPCEEWLALADALEANRAEYREPSLPDRIRSLVARHRRYGMRCASIDVWPVDAGVIRTLHRTITDPATLAVSAAEAIIRDHQRTG